VTKPPAAMICVGIKCVKYLINLATNVAI